VDYVRNVGLLTERTYLFHAVWADQSDVETIASSRARVVHCPGSNMKLGSGIAPVKRLLEAGAPVSLGSDNFSANDAASMFEQMKLACLLSRVGGEAPDSWITAHDAYAMAIGGQTSALSAEDLFAPGKPADLVLLRKTARCFQPENNLVRQLVFAADASTVETVLVSGRIVLDQGRFTTIDEQGLYAELQHRLPAIRAKLERSEVVGNQLRPILAAAFQRATTSPNPPGPCR
jgi:5-methylthioadenosine/S-adenosylhomocysteine deaminase